jgi:hypothetical protein
LTDLKPLSQLETNLVRMFIGWFVEKWMFFLLIKSTQKNQRPKCWKKCVVLMVSSETAGPIGNKLGRNVHWMVRWEVNGFFYDQKYTKETRGPKVSKSVLFVIIVFSETTWIIGTKLGKNVHWKILWKLNVFFKG